MKRRRNGLHSLGRDKMKKPLKSYAYAVNVPVEIECSFVVERYEKLSRKELLKSITLNDITSPLDYTEIFESNPEYFVSEHIKPNSKGNFTKRIGVFFLGEEIVVEGEYVKKRDTRKKIKTKTTKKKIKKKVTKKIKKKVTKKKVKKKSKR
jgi:hypothetical protein